jgi:hypothetical protein
MKIQGINPLRAAYERMHGLPPTGYSDEEVVKILLEEAGGLTEEEKEYILQYLRSEEMQYSSEIQRVSIIEWAEIAFRARSLVA